ncbi:ABC transporter ATP-binding protein [Olivibacter sp. CPCC 100613]|uniref:ABC transporter ATP-binding protein n=1 Tax=Olivibacter sp. CPCC 100613 TaxID=3079931 RepID=UPI002FFC5A99
MLIGKNLSKSYLSKVALDNVSIEVAPGEICGLLGRNGAGKTTLFKILTGLIKADHGEVIIQSSRPKPIGAIIERPGLYNYLNAYDNLKIFAGIQDAKHDRDSIRGYLLKVGLPVDRKDPVRNFSLGMKQRLGIAIALLNNPSCLILDEPFSGLDPIGVASLIDLILNLASRQGIAILLSSHLMGELSKCCRSLYVMDEGRIVNSGATQYLINQHISSYSIVANNIESSKILSKYNTLVGVNEVKVTCNSSEITDLLNELLVEGIQVTACIPDLTLEQLIKGTS